MFEDSLFACNSRSYPKSWTALVSFTIQALFVGSLIVVPMLLTDALPRNASRAIVQIQPILREAEAKTKPTTHSRQREKSSVQIAHTPPSGQRLVIPEANPFADRSGQNVDAPSLTGLEGNKTGDSEISVLLNPGRSVMPTIQNASPKRWRVSGGVEQGLLMRNIKPIYPRLAQAAGVQGEVVLQAVIGKDGRIENLHAVSGNPLLVKAALDAVQQWRYRPYLLNGEPVEVETQITVRFTVS